MWGLLAIFIACFVLNAAEPCITPLGQQSRCVTINECPEISNRIRYGIDQKTVDFLRQSKCGCDVQNPRVCCGPLPTYREEDKILRGIDVDVLEDSFLTPSSECGREPLSDGNRIISGTRTEIGEFPWLALLWYRSHRTGKLAYKCGGALINRRYVLTAAHCLTGRHLDEFGTIVSVSLGEHDVQNTTDCVDGVCSGPPQTIPVLATYPYPGFSDRYFNKQDDVGLIRLARRVQYTEVVQPICLDQSGQWDIGDEVLVAGWGKTLQGKFSNEKLKVSLSIANKAKCVQQFRSHHKISLTNSQLCVGGEFLKDACRGDSGGPAMRRRGAQWEAIGLVSFGYGCGRDDWPGVYTMVSSYYGWILETLRKTNLCPARY